MIPIVKTGLTALICIIANSFQGYAQFSLSGEIRPRSEYRHGYKTLADQDQDAAFFIDQRTRVNLMYKSDAYKIKFTLQDVRTWGSQPQLVTNGGALTSIHEAWGEVNIGQKFAFKLGLQEIIQDDHRMFGNVGWFQQARSHDAGILKFIDSTFTAHLGLAFNQDQPKLENTIYTVPNSYKTFQYLWMHKDWGQFKGSFLFLNNGLQVISSTDTRTNFSQTIGGRLEYKKNNLTTNVNFYYQTGTDGDTLDTDINAWLFGQEILYKLNNQFTMGVGADLISGNSQVNPASENQAFNPFYGTNHKFNGFMDYFYVGNHFGSVGLFDYILILKFKEGKFSSGTDIHFFFSADDILDQEELINSGNIRALGSRLGTELDITFGWAFSGGVNLKAGYSQMFATESLVALKGGDQDAVSNWGWMMLILKPQFIKGEI